MLVQLSLYILEKNKTEHIMLAPNELLRNVFCYLIVLVSGICVT